MPTYAYRRDDGTTFEIQQRISDAPLEECPETGQSVERIITGSPGIITDSNASASNDSARASQNPTCAGPLCGL